VSRIAGRNGRIYLGLSSAGVAEPVAYQADWAISHKTTKIDVTAMGDTTKVNLSGLPEANGTFAGFYDDASVQTYTAAVDGIARRFYLYPNLATPTQYWWGTVVVDMDIDASVDGPVKVSASWSGATPVIKQG
jgi:hypothetical protein